MLRTDLDWSINIILRKVELHTVNNFSLNKEFPSLHQYWFLFPPFPYGLWLVIRGNESTLQKAFSITGHKYQGIKDSYFINIPEALRISGSRF